MSKFDEMLDPLSKDQLKRLVIWYACAFAPAANFMDSTWLAHLGEQLQKRLDATDQTVDRQTVKQLTEFTVTELAEILQPLIDRMNDA